MTREEAKSEIEKVFEPAFANYIIKALTDGATESDVELQGDSISREVILNKITEIDKLSKVGKTDEALALMKECFESLTPKQNEWISVLDEVEAEINGEINGLMGDAEYQSVIKGLGIALDAVERVKRMKGAHKGV